MTSAKARAVLHRLAALPREARLGMLRALPEPAFRAIADEWWWQAHGGQVEPALAANGLPWRIWTIVAGRGFGKTRAGSEWVWALARANPGARIALVAASLDEVARVMVEGDSGLMATARCDERPRWISSRGLLLFPSGAEAHAFTAEKPDKLRGPQHHFAWCDELAKWPHADDTWNNLMLGLRLGDAPRTLVTTTPRPTALFRRIIGDPATAKTEGRTAENPHLPADYQAAMTAMFAGTRLARQELDGVLLEDFEDAMFTREMLDAARQPSPTWREGRLAEGERGEGLFARTLIGLDPPASTGGDACGIVVCARTEDGTAHVLADLSARGLSPERWARRVAAAARDWDATLIVAEANNGGDMIAANLRAVDADLPVRLVHATKSKPARAEAVALRFENGRAKLAGHFPELEDQLCAMTWAGYQGSGSPDRLDAMVWAMTELFKHGGGEPRIRAL